MPATGGEILAILSACAVALGCAKLANSEDSTWKTLSFGPFSFSAPPDVARTGEQGIDSAFAAWEGESVRITIDSGPFSDPLRSYQNRPNFKAREETIGGGTARVVEFDELDDKRFVGAHFSSPDVFTVVVVSKKGVDTDVARRVVDGIRFQKPRQ